MDCALYDDRGFSGICLTNLHGHLKCDDVFRVKVGLTCEHQHAHTHGNVCTLCRADSHYSVLIRRNLNNAQTKQPDS